MHRDLIGLRFSGEIPLDQSAELMRITLRTLVERCHATYDRLLYPYADTLLLFSEEPRNFTFGTHALLMGFEADELAAAVHSAQKSVKAANIETEIAARSVECTGADIASFLSEGVCEENHEYIGDFAALLAADARPYDIRETARKLCSFCEQASRTEGVKVHGLMGGSVCADVEPDAVDGIIKLYRAKTGGSAVR